MLSKEREISLKNDLMSIKSVSYRSYDETKILHMILSFEKIPEILDKYIGESSIMYALTLVKNKNLSNSTDSDYDEILDNIKNENIEKVKVYFMLNREIPNDIKSKEFEEVIKSNKH